MNTTKELLFAAEIPHQTESYNPVPHKILVEAVEERLDIRNLKIADERYDSNKVKSQMFGVLSVDTGNDSQQMSIGFRNSYDKTLAVGLVAGSQVIVCSNLMFGGDIKLLRKHTAGVYKDLYKLVDNVIDYALEDHQIMLKDSKIFKEYEMPKVVMARLAGEMFIEHNMLTTVQLSIIKRQIQDSKNFKGETLWDFYNHTTEALKVSHPLRVMQDHVNFHSFAKELVY